MATCYRHPDRETGVACSNCERPICPDCMTSTPVGMRCPECARDRTQVRSLRSLELQPTLTYVLIGINVVVAVGSFLSGGGVLGTGGPLVALGAVAAPPVAHGEVWRLVTSGFIHFGVFHLLVNMFALYILGGMLEPVLGRLRFGLIYLVSLLSGSFGALLVQPQALTAGASGAIFGLLGAAVVLSRIRGISLRESGLGVVIVINLAITLLNPAISLGGHIGGFIGGLLSAAIFLSLGERLRLPRAVPMVVVVALGALAVTGAIAVSTGVAG